MHARGVGEMLDLAVDLFVACLVPTVGLAFLMWLPVRILWVLFGQELEGELAPEVAQFAISLLGGTLVQILSVALVIRVVYAELQGERTTLHKPLVAAFKRAPALLLASMIIGISTGLGTVCFFVPGIFLMYIWSVAPAALVLEGRGPLECLRRSQRLVGKSFLRWAGVMLCVTALKSPYELAAVYLDQPVTMRWALEDLQVPQLAYSFAQIAVSSLLLSISTAAGAIVVTVFYLDCRVRQEGFDLSMRLERRQKAALGGRAR